MRLLFANERCGHLGGAEQNVAWVARALAERGHTVGLAYGRDTDRDADNYRNLFAGAYACPELAGEERAPGLAAAAEIFRPDIIYAHRVSSIQPLIKLGLPVVRMVHDHDLCCPRRHKYYAWNNVICKHKAGWRCWLDMAFIERARETKLGFRPVNLLARKREMLANWKVQRVLVGSSFMREEVIQNGCASECVEILPPVVPLPARPFTAVTSEPHVLYAGQLIRGKGVDLLIRALARVRAPFTAEIVGAGNATQGLKQLAGQLGIAAQILFRGFVPTEELGDLYRRCRMLIVPSRWPEPFGMIGLEAMSWARPVVGFAVGGIPDWLEHEVNGLLVQEGDVAGLAAAMNRLLLDRTLACRLGENGYARVRERFSFERYIDRLEQVLG